MLLNDEQLTVQDADAVAAAVAHFRKRPSLGFSDCLVLEVARKAGQIPLGIVRQKLARLDGVERIRFGVDAEPPTQPEARSPKPSRSHP